MLKVSGKRPTVILAIEIVSVLLFLGDLVLAEFDWWHGIFIEISAAGILLALALLVTRRRNAIARLALTILIIGGGAVTLYLAASKDLAFWEFTQIELVVFIAAIGLTIVQLVLLWSNSASLWIADNHRDMLESSTQ